MAAVRQRRETEGGGGASAKALCAAVRDLPVSS